MIRIKKLFLVGILVLILVMGLSCSMVPKGIQNLFSTKTPTPTNTATSTPTPTVTPTPTKTPMPPVMLYDCVFISNCPQAKNVSDVSSGPIEWYSYNTIYVPIDQPVQILHDWTTIDEASLYESLPNIQWVFSIDGQDYFNPAWLEDGVVPDEDDPSINYPGKWFGAVMQSWKLGEQHLVKIGIIIKQTTGDGWGIFDTGTTFVTTYNFIPIEKPTVTPTATPTRTNTPRPPTAVPYTKTPKPALVPTNPPCVIDSTIDIDNTTGAYVTLNLSGPMKFHFELAPGNTSLNVCSGTYTYKAWGCGGATDSGEMRSGEGHEFYCN